MSMGKLTIRPTISVLVCLALGLPSMHAAAQQGTLLVVNRHAEAGSISFFDLESEIEIARVPSVRVGRMKWRCRRTGAWR